jgi:hypothetical protein
MIPNNDNTYLRYFTENNGEEIDEIFIPIIDLHDSGVPIDAEGCDMDCDGYLYVFNGNNFEQVVTFGVIK